MSLSCLDIIFIQPCEMLTLDKVTSLLVHTDHSNKLVYTFYNFDVYNFADNHQGYNQYIVYTIIFRSKS